MKENDSENKDDKKKNAKDGKLPKLIGTAILMALVIFVIVFGSYSIYESVTYVSTDDASIDGGHVNISAKTLGRIKAVSVTEGDDVKAGQVLVMLDDADLRAQEAQSAASLNYARQNAILAKVNLDRIQEDYNRAKALYDSGVSTREQFIHAGGALETAKAQYSIALAQVETASAQLGVLETQLLNFKIMAPIAGIIAKQALIAGDVVQPGQTIATINDLRNIWIVANFEESKIRRIKVDSPVDIRVDAYPDRAFKGRVARIGAGIVAPSFSIGEFTKTTRRIPVKITFDTIPDSMLLLPGMWVEVKVIGK